MLKGVWRIIAKSASIVTIISALCVGVQGIIAYDSSQIQLLIQADPKSFFIWFMIVGTLCLITLIFSIWMYFRHKKRLQALFTINFIDVAWAWSIEFIPKNENQSITYTSIVQLQANCPKCKGMMEVQSIGEKAVVIQCMSDECKTKKNYNDGDENRLYHQVKLKIEKHRKEMSKLY